MKEPRIDPETLAALLDGRLDERRRAEVLERLALSEDDLESYADAVVVTHELEGADRAEGIVPLTPRRTAAEPRRWGTPGRWLAVAAMLALLALVPWAWLRTGTPAGPTDPGIYVALLSEPDAGLPDGWQLRPWGATRSAADPLSREVRAARLGARIVDVEVMLRAQDTGAGRLAAEITVLLDEIPASGPVASMYRELGRRAGEPPSELEPLLARARTAVVRVADEEFVLLGAWAEAARIAAARQNATFFRARETRHALDRGASLLNLDGPARTALEQVRGRLPLADPPDWPTLKSELTALLAALGSQTAAPGPTSGL